MIKVCILDYGSGNVKSVLNLFSSITKNIVVSNNPTEIQKATHIILPGVGAFSAAMRKIHERLPIDILEEVVLGNKRPFLGICVGMQVLATRGMEFGECRGLGWIDGIVEKIETQHLPLPHIGWNNISQKRESPLLDGLRTDSDFYFVHSYALRLEENQQILATTNYEEEFCSILQQDNIYGVQFHPEKSQQAGINLAKNFLSLI